MFERAVRLLVAFVLRRMPPGMRGRTRLLEFADSHLTKRSPLVCSRMRPTGRLQLDLRSRMESLAYFTGGHEDTLIRGALMVLPPGGTALDVGANIGFWTIPLAKVAGTVHAYEPLGANADRLAANVALNDVGSHVQIHRCGLSDTSATAVLRVLEDPSRGPSTGNAALGVETLADAGTEEIHLTTLDADVERIGLERLDLIKIDIEGHESAFFKGARATLAKFRPTMWVEWNGYVYGLNGGDPAGEIAAELDALDYAVLGRVEGQWQQLETFFSPLPLDDLVAVPRERHATVLAALRTL